MSQVVMRTKDGFKPPDSLLKLGARSGPCVPTLDEVDMAVIGRWGSGKSSLVASDAGTIVLDFKRGTDAVERPLATIIPVKDYAHYEAVIDAIVDARKVEKRYVRVAFDSSPEWLEFVGREVIRDWNTRAKTDYETLGEIGDGRIGWDRRRERAKAHVARLKEAGFAVTYTIPLVDKKSGETSKAEPGVSEGLRDWLLGEPGLVLTVARVSRKVRGTVTKKFTVGGKEQTTTVPDGPERTVNEYLADACQGPGDPRYSKVRVPIDEVISLPDMSDPANPPAMATVRNVYEEARQRLLDRLNGLTAEKPKE